MAKTNTADKPARTRKTTVSAAESTKPVKPAKAVKPAKLPRLPKALAGAIAAARDKKAENLVLLDLRKADSFTDFFLIATGANPRQIVAVADNVQERLKADFAERPALAEGTHKSEWVLLDYFDFVVHVFSRECRAFYDLERLWGNAVRHELADEAPLGAAAPAAD